MNALRRMPCSAVLALTLTTACSAGHVADSTAQAETGGSSTTGSASGTTGAAGAGGNLPTTGNLAIYWGQDFAKDQGSLADACNNSAYTIVIISFVTSFPKGRNTGDFPEMAIDDAACTAFNTENPYLLKCDDIAAAIPVCQANGKKVLLSFGGADGSYGFTGDTDATQFAQTVWDIFLGGQSTTRPFGNANLDGIDLDIEGGSPTGYATFVTALRTLMNNDTSKHYYITGAPQCPYPDAYLGAALTNAASAFDYLFVQFYNNYCSPSDPNAFTTSLAQWSALQTNGGPRILVGLPAAVQGASTGYIAPSDLPAVMSLAKQSPAFAGTMLWDVSFDKQSAAAGTAYSTSIIDAMKLSEKGTF